MGEGETGRLGNQGQQRRRQSDTRVVTSTAGCAAPWYVLSVRVLGRRRMALRPCGAGVSGAGLQFRSTMGGSGVSPQWGWWTGGCFFPTQGLLRAVLLHPGLWRGARFGEGLLVQRCPRGPAQGKPGFTALPERGKTLLAASTCPAACPQGTRMSPLPCPAAPGPRTSLRLGLS